MTRSRKKPARKVAETKPAPDAWRMFTRARAVIMGWLPIIAIFLGTRTLLAEAYRIPSGSMEPTLQVGDWLFVNKLRFGPHIPFTDVSLPGYAEPRRNDVVVFESPPQDPAIRIAPDEVTPILVKRIVGMPGDTLFMRGGALFVNGTVVPPLNTEMSLPDSVVDQVHPLFDWQHAIEARGSRFGPPVTVPSTRRWGPLIVPPGMFFMMGDNRDNSVDSRYYGLVPRANLRGTPTFVYYSYDPNEGLDWFRALTEIRWRRLGTWIR
jgi:signal peptidase I